MTAQPRDLAATPLLQHALEQLRLEGAIFFHSELTEPFAFESTLSALADQLHPGAERVIPLVSDDPLFDPALQVFPSAFVVRLADGAAKRWVQATVTYAVSEHVPSNASSSVAATRLPELVLIEVLRHHLASAPAADRGWLAALHDPVLAPALSLLHADPARRWTVGDLAAEVAVSRSVLDERFRQVLGRSPIRDLTEWRMHLAEELLDTTELGVVPIARRVGYESEEAFSRAFKRAHGDSPGRWRARDRHAIDEGEQ